MAKDTTATAKRDVVYFRDGQPMARGHEGKLSTFAYLFTKDVKRNAPRISTAEFVTLLKKLGVDDPAAPGWMVELPNGVTIEARRPGASPKYKPQAEGVPAKRAKTVAKKTRKAAAKKKSGKTQVTPLPKRATTKKTVAAAAARRRTTRVRA